MDGLQARRHQGDTSIRASLRSDQAAAINSALGFTHTMSAVQPCEVPLGTLLRRYKDGTGFADCYAVEVPGAITQAAFIEAFYTSPLFKVERTILKYAVSRPATDSDAKELAAGKAGKFSAWNVERHSPSELLLADFTGRTRSWLSAVVAHTPNSSPHTTLYFGSAVVPRDRHGAAPNASMGWAFYALMGFHRLYSRMLLSAASKRVVRA